MFKNLFLDVISIDISVKTVELHDHKINVLFQR